MRSRIIIIAVFIFIASFLTVTPEAAQAAKVQIPGDGNGRSFILTLSSPTSPMTDMWVKDVKAGTKYKAPNAYRLSAGSLACPAGGDPLADTWTLRRTEESNGTAKRTFYTVWRQEKIRTDMRYEAGPVGAFPNVDISVARFGPGLENDVRVYVLIGGKIYVNGKQYNGATKGTLNGNSVVIEAFPFSQTADEIFVSTDKFFSVRDAWDDPRDAEDSTSKIVTLEGNDVVEYPSVGAWQAGGPKKKLISLSDFKGEGLARWYNYTIGYVGGAAPIMVNNVYPNRTREDVGTANLQMLKNPVAAGYSGVYTIILPGGTLAMRCDSPTNIPSDTVVKIYEPEVQLNRVAMAKGEIVDANNDNANDLGYNWEDYRGPTAIKGMIVHTFTVGQLLSGVGYSGQRGEPMRASCSLDGSGIVVSIACQGGSTWKNTNATHRGFIAGVTVNPITLDTATDGLAVTTATGDDREKPYTLRRKYDAIVPLPGNPARGVSKTEVGLFQDNTQIMGIPIDDTYWNRTYFSVGCGCRGSGWNPWVPEGGREQNPVRDMAVVNVALPDVVTQAFKLDVKMGPKNQAYFLGIEDSGFPAEAVQVENHKYSGSGQIDLDKDTITAYCPKTLVEGSQRYAWSVRQFSVNTADGTKAAKDPLTTRDVVGFLGSWEQARVTGKPPLVAPPANSPDSTLVWYGESEDGHKFGNYIFKDGGRYRIRLTMAAQARDYANTAWPPYIWTSPVKDILIKDDLGQTPDDPKIIGNGSLVDVWVTAKAAEKRFGPLEISFTKGGQTVNEDTTAEVSWQVKWSKDESQRGGNIQKKLAGAAALDIPWAFQIPERVTDAVDKYEGVRYGTIKYKWWIELDNRNNPAIQTKLDAIKNAYATNGKKWGGMVSPAGEFVAPFGGADAGGATASADVPPVEKVTNGSGMTKDQEMRMLGDPDQVAAYRKNQPGVYDEVMKTIGAGKTDAPGVVRWPLAPKDLKFKLTTPIGPAGYKVKLRIDYEFVEFQPSNSNNVATTSGPRNITTSYVPVVRTGWHEIGANLGNPAEDGRIFVNDITKPELSSPLSVNAGGTTGDLYPKKLLYTAIDNNPLGKIETTTFNWQPDPEPAAGSKADYVNTSDSFAKGRSETASAPTRSETFSDSVGSVSDGLDVNDPQVPKYRAKFELPENVLRLPAHTVTDVPFFMEMNDTASPKNTITKADYEANGSTLGKGTITLADNDAPAVFVTANNPVTSKQSYFGASDGQPWPDSAENTKKSLNYAAFSPEAWPAGVADKVNSGVIQNADVGFYAKVETPNSNGRGFTEVKINRDPGNAKNPQNAVQDVDPNGLIDATDNAVNGNQDVRLRYPSNARFRMDLAWNDNLPKGSVLESVWIKHNGSILAPSGMAVDGGSVSENPIDFKLDQNAMTASLTHMFREPSKDDSDELDVKVKDAKGNVRHVRIPFKIESVAFSSIMMESSQQKK